MEGLYKKLYSKYTKLKKEKDTEMEELNHDQEIKFVNYVTVAEEIIECLKSENERLSKEVGELRSEISSISSTKDEKCIQYQMLLMEEDQKNKKLLEEIERLRNGDKVDCGPQGTPTSSTSRPFAKKKAGPNSNSITVAMTRKRARELDLCSENRTRVTEEVMLDPISAEHRSYKQTEVDDSPLDSFLPPCCRRKTNGSDNDAKNTVPISCKFQDLVEYVLGMQLSTNPENDKFSISVNHPSSGYSFSLTWVNTSSGEPEFLYQLLSLGTFERVAPEWMKDILMFSPRMCSVFFERVSRVIKLNH